MIEQSKHYALAVTCGAKRGPKDTDLTFSPASLRDFLKALVDQPALATYTCGVCGVSMQMEQPAQQEPTQWQPIETAPKDGRMILVCLPRQMDLVVRAWYREYKGFWLTDEQTDGGITRPVFFHEGDLWHPIPPINKTTKKGNT